MSEGVVATIKSKLDIVEIVGESVPLKKAGTTYKGLCPFHGEKTPSFVVTPARESWHCFGCGLGGDVFSFVMQREGIDFAEALKRLAGRAGVELDERTSREDARRKRLRDVLEAAIAFYHRVLVDTRHGQAALDYLRGRGFTEATIETFQLGWAPDAWEPLAKALKTKRGATDQELEAVGLGIRGRRGSVYDRFRGRIIFPIRDASGYATGLGGRILETHEADAPAGADAGDDAGASRLAHAPGGGGATRDRGPKYLNSPATPLFDKSRSLYLIDRARGPMRKTGRAVIVEGYTDALMAHQAGFENVVAGLGTALTAAQVELVTRYAPSVALAYDVDPAGQSAGTFGATELTALISEIQQSGAKIGLTEVGVVRLPEGRDPDEVIRDERATWEAAVEHPQPIMDYLIDFFARREDMHTPGGRNRLVQAVAPTLRLIGNPVVRDSYVQALARRASVGERTVLEVLARPETGRRGADDPGVTGHGTGKFTVDAVLAAREEVDPAAAAAALDPTEQELLGLLLRNPEQREHLAGFAPELLLTTPARELWRAIFAADDAARAEAPQAPGASIEVIGRGLDPELALIARGLLLRRGPLPEGDRAARAIDQCLIVLERHRIDEELDYLRADLAELEARRDAAARDAQGQRIRTLQRERADLDRRAAASTVLSRTPVGGTV